MKPDFASTLEGAHLIAPELLDLTADKPRLRISHCNECGHDTFPVAPVCPSCMSLDMAEQPMDGSGTLYSFSVVHVAPKHWNAPYAIGYVDLPGGLRVLGQIQQSLEKIAIGSRYVLDLGVVGRKPDGEPASSYVFVPEVSDA